MPQPTLFVQTQREPRIQEVTVPENVTQAELRTALSSAGVPISPELFIFLDEAEEPIGHEDNCAVPGIKHGRRIHITCCRHTEVTVHFLNQKIEHKFPPGARVRRVKAWAAEQFHINHKDAAEHVLQVCNTNKRPPSDTPLHTLVQGHDCAVCFDLVPEKRVEG